MYEETMTGSLVINIPDIYMKIVNGLSEKGF